MEVIDPREAVAVVMDPLCSALPASARQEHSGMTQVGVALQEGP